MTRTKEERQAFLKPFQLNDKDTGSVEVQVAALTDRIKDLTEHFKLNKKDFSLKKGLLHMVSKRRSFLNYLEKQDAQKCHDLMKKLGLNKK